MSTLKRIPIKYVRDRAKSRYVKAAHCYVCGIGGSLDFHHLFTVDILFDNWLKVNKIKINTVEDIIEHNTCPKLTIEYNQKDNYLLFQDNGSGALIGLR